MHVWFHDERTYLAVELRGRCPQYIGRLGSIRLPIDPAGRERFWAGLAERFRYIDVRFPGLVSPAAKLEAIAAISERIPRHVQSPSARAETLKRGARDGPSPAAPP
jgi:hypothetical protein